MYRITFELKTEKALDEALLTALQNRADNWYFMDSVFYLNNEQLGGTMTYYGVPSDMALEDLWGLLSEASGNELLDAKLSYFLMEEIAEES